MIIAFLKIPETLAGAVVRVSARRLLSACQAVCVAGAFAGAGAVVQFKARDVVS